MTLLKEARLKGHSESVSVFVVLPCENAVTNLKVRAHLLEAGQPLWQDCGCSSSNTDIFIGSLPLKKTKDSLLVQGYYLFKDCHSERSNFQAFKWNAHRYIGVRAGDVFIMAAEYRRVNPSTQSSADSSSWRPHWLQCLHLKIMRLQFVCVGGNAARALAEVRGLRQKPSCTRHSLRPNTLTTLSVVLMHHSWPVGLNDFSEPWRSQSCYVFVWLRSHMFALATVSRPKMTLSGGLLTLIFD